MKKRSSCLAKEKNEKTLTGPVADGGDGQAEHKRSSWIQEKIWRGVGYGGRIPSQRQRRTVRMLLARWVSWKISCFGRAHRG